MQLSWGIESSLVWSRGKAPIGGMGDEEAEIFGTFAHNILHFCVCKILFTGKKGPSPKWYATASSANPPFSAALFPPESGGGCSEILPGKKLKFSIALSKL